MHFNLKRPRCSTKTFSIERSRRVRNARGLRSRVTDTEAHILQNSFGNGFLNFFLSCRPSYVEIDIFLRMRLICLRKAAFRSMYSYITSEIFETRCRGKICCRVRASVGGGGETRTGAPTFWKTTSRRFVTINFFSLRMSSSSNKRRRAAPPPVEMFSPLAFQVIKWNFPDSLCLSNMERPPPPHHLLPPS